MQTAVTNGVVTQRNDTIAPNISISDAPRAPVKEDDVRVR